MKYYFCSDECKTSFDANPGKYTRSQEAHHNLEHNCC
ncbi:MAG: YHS domain-containing protein [Candidatus Thermoplasmatota archaeon]|nr:YHS domain-containing protein [Candidatus Thermoplasmatota archaeon]